MGWNHYRIGRDHLNTFNFKLIQKLSNVKVCEKKTKFDLVFFDLMMEVRVTWKTNFYILDTLFVVDP